MSLLAEGADLDRSHTVNELRQPEIIIACDEGWIVGSMFVGASHLKASTCFTAAQVVDTDRGPQVRGAGEGRTAFHAVHTMVQIPNVTEPTVFVFTNFFVDDQGEKRAAPTYLLASPDEKPRRIRYSEALAHFGVQAPERPEMKTFTPKTA